MSLIQASRLDEIVTPASGLNSYAGREPRATVQLRAGTTGRRVAGLHERRAADAGTT